MEGGEDSADHFSIAPRQEFDRQDKAVDFYLLEVNDPSSPQPTLFERIRAVVGL